VIRRPLARCALAAAALALAAATVKGQSARDRGPGDPAGRAAYRPGVDVLDYDLSIWVPDTGSAIHGRATLSVRRTQPLDTLVLDLVSMRVDGVLVDGRPAPFRRDGATVRVRLPSGGDDTLAVTVRYGGVVRDGLVISTDGDGRWQAFGDNWPTRARYWFPAVDHPSDKATVSWTVNAPSDRRVVANGTLREETPLGSPPGGGLPRTVTRWRETRPIPPYLMVIAVAPLAFLDLGPSACIPDETGGCAPQSVYVSPGVRDFLPGPFARAGDILNFFAGLIAPFPYEKLAHVQSSTIFGGMENASAIFYTSRGFQRRDMQPDLIAHESAHQWFGDAVTERDWAHLWLSEGFATYFAQLWEQHAFGDSTFRANLAAMRDQIVRAPEVAQRPVIDTAQTELMQLLNANSYAKGGWTLHMLRGMLGDSAFFRGIRDYYKAHVHGNATTDDLERALEASSGRELGWFFDQWLRRPGFADLTTAWSWDVHTHRLTIVVTQGARFAPYRFPLTVEVADVGGARRRATVEIGATRETRLSLPIDVPDEPKQVTFDPDVQLLAAFTAR
jgi:aminopeptidase N